MSSSTDRRTGSRSKSAPFSQLRWPSEQGANSKRVASAGGVPPQEDEGGQEAHQDPYVAEGMRQLALSVMIVLALAFFFFRIFGPNDAQVVGAASHDVSRAPPASLANASQPPWASSTAPAARLDVQFDHPGPAGRPTPLRLNVANAPEGSTIVVSGLGPNTTLSAGENRDVEWRLGQADWSNLSVIPPKDFVGTILLVFELRLPNGAVAGRQIVKLEWAGEAAAESGTEAARAAPAPTGGEAPSEALAEAAPVADSAKEKQLARAMPETEAPPAATAEAPPSRTEAPATPEAVTRAEPEESNAGRVSPCFAKLDGKIVLQGNCRVASVEGKSVTFESGEKRLSLTLDHGRIWRLKWNDEDKGRIYKREECWGSDKAFVCEHPPRAKPKS